MAGGGAAPPAEAVKGARGVSAAVTVVIAIVTFLGGLGVGAFFLAPAPTGAPVTFLIVGTNTPFPPFVQRNRTTTAIEGFDVDLIVKILDRSGWKDKYDLIDYRSFEPLLTAIAKGQVHVMIGGITSNLETGARRNATIDFTDWCYESDQGVLVRKTETRDICPNPNDCTAADLNKTAYAGKVGVQEVTTSFYWADAELANVKPLKVYGGVSELLLALKQNAVDIVIIDKPAADGIVAQNPNDFKAEGAIQTNELYAFAVNNNDPLGLLPKFNAALAAMKQDGTYRQIFLKWFKTEPPA